MIQTQCRHFNGYKPCGKNTECSIQCPHLDRVEDSVLIVHLGALGAVVRSTAMLGEIRKKYPRSVVTWVTDKPADQILRNHPLIDRVLTSGADDLLLLKALKFEAAFVVDKSLKAAAILETARVEKAFGFHADPVTGAIIPATAAGNELWQLGLSNQKKFFINKKSELQLMLEAFELREAQIEVASDLPKYNLPLMPTENLLKEKRRQHWQLNADQPILGLNTGCSAVIAAKKLTVQFQREIIQKLLARGFENIVLLGGPEDTERNFQIGEGLPVFQSPTSLGLRDGLVSVAACDVVLTGDSLGMHMALSQEKFVVAWFGPTCAQEIELFGRGVKIQSKAACAPCWKRTCDKTEMCYDQVDATEIIQAIEQGLSWWRQQNEFLLSKPLSSAI
ncbi:MAG: glycosyltransferase family 9 protein [Pseudobdellovibrionaceae bacterium]